MKKIENIIENLAQAFIDAFLGNLKSEVAYQQARCFQSVSKQKYLQNQF
jgi:hypothetical protein